MKKINRLKKEALEACKFRGHNMKRFVKHNYWSNIQYAHCRDCNMQVVVNNRPQPNEIDIGGEAIALTCTG